MTPGTGIISRQSSTAPPPKQDSPAGGASYLVLWVTLLALLLRSIQLDFQPLWWDEGYSVWFANQPPAEMLRLTALDIHPPLYYALLHGWSRLFGLAPAVLRLFSLFAGLLSVPLIYWLGSQLAGRRAGLLAAFLLAISPLHIFYSQEVRMYALAALWGLLAVGMAALWLEAAGGERERGQGGEEKWLIGYGMAALLGLYTLYYFAFLLLGVAIAGVWMLWRRSREVRRWIKWLITHGLIGLFYLPWLLYAAPRLVPYVSQKVVADSDQPLSLLAYLARHLAAFNVGHLEGSLASWWPIGLLGLLPVAWALLSHRGRRTAGHSASSHFPTPHLLPFLAIIQATLLIAGWLVNLTFPFFPDRGERLLLIALPVWILFLAAALGRERGKRFHRLRWTPYALLAALSLAAFYTTPRYAEEDYRPLIGQVVQWGRPEDTVFTIFPWQAGYFWSYGPANGPQPELSPSERWGPEVTQALDAALARGRVWFPEHLSLGGLLEGAVEEHLAGQAHLLINRWYSPSTRLTGWAAPRAGASQQAGPFLFSNGDRLGRVDFGPTAIEAANDTIFVDLGWQGAPSSPRHITLRLVGPDGLAWAQQNYLLSGEEGRDAIALLAPSAAPPGPYDLRLAVAAGEAGPPLTILDAAGQPMGSEASLGMAIIDAPATPLGLETLAVQEPLAADFAGQMRLVGFSAGQGPLAPGEDLKISLFWQISTAPQGDLFAFVQLLDDQGQIAAAWEGPPVAWHLASAWQAGQWLRSQHLLRLPARTSDGNYRLIAGLFDPATAERLPVQRGIMGRNRDYVELGPIQVAGREHVMTPPDPQTPAQADLASLGRLVGYDLPARTARPGQPLALTLHWQATGSTGQRFKVFVHLLDATGAIAGQSDQEPGAGAFPTSSWLPGEFLIDDHSLAVRPDALAGPARLIVGLYDPQTGQRLPWLDAAGQPSDQPLTLQSILIVAAD